MIACPFCLERQGLKCGCGTNHPFKFMNGLVYCMGCQQSYRGNFQPKAMVEQHTEADANGNAISVIACPVHAGYRLGVPKVNVQQCSKCGHVEERPVKASQGMGGISKANDDPDAVRRSIFGS